MIKPFCRPMAGRNRRFCRSLLAMTSLPVGLLDDQRRKGHWAGRMEGVKREGGGNIGRAGGWRLCCIYATQIESRSRDAERKVKS